MPSCQICNLLQSDNFDVLSLCDNAFIAAGALTRALSGAGGQSAARACRPQPCCPAATPPPPVPDRSPAPLPDKCSFLGRMTHNFQEVESFLLSWQEVESFRIAEAEVESFYPKGLVLG